MSALKELAYLIVESDHLEQWEAFGSQVLGAEVARRADGSVRMRIDDHAQRFVVQPSPGRCGPTTRSASGGTASEPDLECAARSASGR